jgi:hypothetical protein
MPIMIKFYMVVGRDEEYENTIRSVINEVKDKFKEKGINATFIRIKPEAVDAALYALNMPDNQIPRNLLYLVKSMRQDGIKSLPALIINGTKIYEGQLPSPQIVRQKVMDEITALLIPTQPAQQAPPLPPSLTPQETTPPPPQPIEKPPTETIKEAQPSEVQPRITEAIVKPPTESIKETQPSETRPSTTVLQPSILTQYTTQSGIKVVVGRPNDCRECIYYGTNTNTCLLFGYKITDPTRPPCKT